MTVRRAGAGGAGGSRVWNRRPAVAYARGMAVNWSQVQALYEPTLEAHWARCRDELALDCPIEVFEELFFEHHGDALFADLCRAVDWQGVIWRETELSGVALRRVAVDAFYQHAVDEARERTLIEGLVDDRPEIVAFWVEHGTWFRPPVLVTGEVTGSGFQYELLVGFTRLGNLLGLLDREEVPESRRHRVWLGHLEAS